MCVRPVSELLRALAHMLQDSLRRPPSEALLLDNYGKLVLTVDEMICEVSCLMCAQASEQSSKASDGCCRAS